MTSWFPLRTAPPEPLCPPSTSYAVVCTSSCASRFRIRRCGGQSVRGRALHRFCCKASQALKIYHNTYKLLHTSSRSAEPSVASDAADGQQRQKSRSRPRSKSVTSDPGSSSPSGQATSEPTHSNSNQSASMLSSASGLNPSSIAERGSPNANFTLATSTLRGFEPGTEDIRPYNPHSVSLPHWQPPPTSLQHRTALTRAITNCTSYTRLHQLIVDNATDFNSYHTCAALSRVLALHSAGLSPRESRLFKEGCSTLQAILRRQLSELQPRALVVAAYSLARLELPDRELLAGLAAAVEPHLNTLQPQGLASLIWAFARQNHQPPPKWMDALLCACTADLGAFGPRDMATVLWALARLHYKVAPARLKQLLEHTQASMGLFCGRSLSNVAYSLALSQQHPGEEWLAAAQARAVALGPSAFSPQGITQMAWGLAKLGTTPTHAFMDLVLEHASQRLPLAPHERLGQRDLQQQQQQKEVGSRGECSSSTQGFRGGRHGRYSGLDLATLMYGLASLGAQPRADLGRRLLAAVQWELPFLEANGMCNCLWACARLRIFPTKMWLSAFFDASYRQLPYFKPVDLSQTLWGLARLQASPPPAWMSSVMTRLQHSASMFSPVEVATTMWALARLGVRGEQMPGEVLALFFIATDRRLSSFKPQELSSMIWALAHMRRRPDKEWAAEFLKVTYHRLASMNGWCLATLAWSLAELSLTPPPAWVYAYVNVARTLMNSTPLPTTQGGGGDLQPGQQQQQAAGGHPRLLAGFVGPAATFRAESAAGLSAMDLGQIITSLRRLNNSSAEGSSSSNCRGGSGGLAKVDEFLGEAEQRLAAMEASSAVYARQQLEAFLAMSPEQAGLSIVVPAMVPEPSGNMGSHLDLEMCVSSNNEAIEEIAGDSAPGAPPFPQRKLPRRSQQQQQQLLSRRALVAEQSRRSDRKRRGQGQRAAKGIRATAAASVTSGDHVSSGANMPASRNGAELLHTAATAAAAKEGHSEAPAASMVTPRDVTRVLNEEGARVTPPAATDVHVHLGGEMNVELPTASCGPVVWRPTVAPGMVGGRSVGSNGESNGIKAGGGNGGADLAAAGVAGGEDVSSSMTEIKRRLLAV